MLWSVRALRVVISTDEWVSVEYGGGDGCEGADYHECESET